MASERGRRPRESRRDRPEGSRSHRPPWSGRLDPGSCPDARVVRLELPGREGRAWLRAVAQAEPPSDSGPRPDSHNQPGADPVRRVGYLVHDHVDDAGFLKPADDAHNSGRHSRTAHARERRSHASRLGQRRQEPHAHGPTRKVPVAGSSPRSRGRLCEDRPVPRPKLTRRLGPVGLALTAWDIWRRLPPKQRKQVIAIARKHGPKVAAKVLEARARVRNRRR